MRKVLNWVIRGGTQNTRIVYRTFSTRHHVSEFQVEVADRQDVLSCYPFSTQIRSCQMFRDVCSNVCPINCTHTSLTTYKNLYP